MRLSVVVLALSVAAPAFAAPQPAGGGIEVQRNGAQPPRKGPPTAFSGSAQLANSFQAKAPGRTGVSTVTFEPGARTGWHTHPLGQILVVSAGCGWVQKEGDPIQLIRPGDVVWIPPGANHWHGATPTTGMTHVAVTEALDGKAVEFTTLVTDEQYRGGPAPTGC